MAGKSLKGSLHAHGCKTCRTRYQDACETLEDGRCTACRGGRTWQLLIDNRAPQDCCRQLSRLARKDEKNTYRLAGARTWFICRACARTHPFDPRREKRT